LAYSLLLPNLQFSLLFHFQQTRKSQ